MIPWRIVLCAVLALATALPAGGQESKPIFRDVPLDHWSYQAVEYLAEAGSYSRRPMGSAKEGRRRPLVRYELGGLTLLMAGEFTRRVGNAASDPSRHARLFELRMQADTLALLAEEYAAELAEVGADSIMLMAPIRMVFANAPAIPGPSPFEDVPTDHWAYNNLQTLLEAGLHAEGVPAAAHGARTRYALGRGTADLLRDLARRLGRDIGGVKAAAEGRPDPLETPAQRLDEIQALRRLVHEFALELRMQGYDDAAIYRDLDALGPAPATDSAPARQD